MIPTLDHRINRLEELYKDLVSIGVDIHFKEPTMILIYSELNGGYIKHIPVKFESMVELHKFIQELKYRFNTDRVFVDPPAGFRGRDFLI